MAVLTSPNGYIFYHYIPTVPGAIVVAVLFAVGLLVISWRSITTRTTFAIPFIVGCLRKLTEQPQSSHHAINWDTSRLTAATVEIVGYVGRAIAKQDESSPLVPFILQSVLLLIAPALLAASIYMTLGRVIRSVHGERCSAIPPSRLTRLFVLSDVVSFFAQATGGGFQASKNFNKKIAEYMILGGLGVQILGFGLFMATALIWHMRMTRRITDTPSTNGTRPWQETMMMLYAVSVFIMMRSIFRVVEYVMGPDEYLLRHEWPLYVFDATLMLLSVGVFAWRYPGKLSNFPVASKDELKNWSDLSLEENHDNLA